MAPDAPSDFFKHSKKIAEDYIETIVFIDDEAEYPEEEKPKELTSPGRKRKIESEPPKKHFTKRKLNAKEVTEVFSGKGMICCILKPGGDTASIVSEIRKSAGRADVFVLDWDIKQDSGYAALEILYQIIHDDIEENTQNPRIRLIIIYTGENVLHDIRDKVNEKLEELFSDVQKDNDFTFQKNHLRISIYAKEGTGIPEEYKDREVSIPELAEKIVNEFTEITKGLVSNAALFSMSVLRQKTALIMANLGKSIDVPFLAHRAMLPNPEDADSQLVDIISSEIHSLLDNYEIGKKAGIKPIKSWIDETNEQTKFHCPVNQRIINKDIIFKWEKRGIHKTSNDLSSYTVSNTRWEKFAKNPHKEIHKIFMTDEGESFNGNCKFAILTSIKKRYPDMPLPILSLGTIVAIQEGANDKMFFCLQPRCDSVCLKKHDVFFPFVPMEEIVGDDKNFDLVIEKEENVFSKFKFDLKPNSLIVYKFSVDGTDRIQAEKRNNHLYFRISNGTEIKFIAELKPQHAQRVANNFASKMSRVGLDESEWLRRNSD